MQIKAVTQMNISPTKNGTRFTTKLDRSYTFFNHGLDSVPVLMLPRCSKYTQSLTTHMQIKDVTKMNISPTQCCY